MLFLLSWSSFTAPVCLVQASARWVDACPQRNKRNISEFDAQTAMIAESFHYILNHNSAPLEEVVLNMRNILQEVSREGRSSEECSWALINKACADAELNYAFDSCKAQDLNNAGLQVCSLYKKHQRASSDSKALAHSIRRELPNILAENNLRYVDTGSAPIIIKNGKKALLVPLFFVILELNTLNRC